MESPQHEGKEGEVSLLWQDISFLKVKSLRTELYKSGGDYGATWEQEYEEESWFVCSALFLYILFEKVEINANSLQLNGAGTELGNIFLTLFGACAKI